MLLSRVPIVALRESGESLILLTWLPIVALRRG